MKTTRSNHPCKSAAPGVFATALLAASAGAQAHTFCVSTAQQLQAALSASSDAGLYHGESNLIEIVKGTYKTGSATGNGPFHYINSAVGVHLDLYGGYNATCTTQTRKASLSVLDGNHASQVLTIHSADGPVSIATLTIQNADSNQPGGGLVINTFPADKSSASVIDSIIQNNHTSSSFGGVFVAVAGSGHILELENNLIVGNSADMGEGAGQAVGNGSQSLIYNNTVSRNTTTATGETGGLACAGTGPCIVINNIFWNNSSFGLYLGSSNADVEYNDYGTLGGTAPATSIGNVSIAPSFVNASGGDFHLAVDSPLHGTSPATFGGFDLEGNSFPISGKGDLGAFAETIFNDSFDDG